MAEDGRHRRQGRRAHDDQGARRAEARPDSRLRQGRPSKDCKGSMHATIEPVRVLRGQRTEDDSVSDPKSDRMKLAPSRSAARSISTRRSSCARGCSGSATRMRRRTSRPTCASSTPARSRPKATPRAGRRFAGWRGENPAAKIVVMGCYATRAPEEVARLPNVTRSGHRQARAARFAGPVRRDRRADGHLGFGRRHRAYVKVQDGCLLRCSFCIIPYVRPQLASRPVEHILDEVRRLVDNGYREVVLTGIHLGHYGVEWNRNAPKQRLDAAVAPGARDRRAAGRFSRAAFEHRSDGGDARADRRDGRSAATRSARICTSRCKAAATACCGGCDAAGAASGSSTAAGC